MRALLVALTGISLLAVAVPAQAQVTIGTATSGNCYPYSCGPTDGVTRWQQGFRSGAFAGPLTFNQLIYSIYTPYQPGTDYDTATYSVDFYYSANPFNALSSNLGTNLGTSIGAFGSFNIGGPAGSSLTLDGALLNYDPMLGDLLLDVNVTGGSSVSGGYNVFFDADYVGADTTRAYTNNGGDNGSDLGGLVTTFALSGAVPEPDTWALIILGFGFVGAAMRRRSTVRTTVKFA